MLAALTVGHIGPSPGPLWPGLCQWQHMMLSLKRWRTVWPSAKPERNQEPPNLRQAGQPLRQESPPRRPPKQNGDSGVSPVFQTGDRARLAPPIQGHDDRRDHEGDRLAAAFRARLLCRCRQEEAEVEPHSRKGGRHAHVSDRQTGRGVVKSENDRRGPIRRSRQSWIGCRQRP